MKREALAHAEERHAFTPPLARGVRRIIAAVEVVGGAMGALLFLRHAVNVARAQPEVWVAAMLPVGAFTCCVVAGMLLWRGVAAGRLLTLIALVLQVPSVRSSTLGYYFNCGVGVRVLNAAHGVSWLAFWGSELHLTFHDAAHRTTLGVNVVALLFAVLLVIDSVHAQDARRERLA